MICTNCKQKNKDGSKFCVVCGQPFEHKTEGSVDKYFAKQYGSCQICGSLAPTKYVEFHQNIGMILSRQDSFVKGRLCKKCIDKKFKKMTLTTFFLEWWGSISFFVTPIYLISNIIRFITTIGMKGSE